MAHNTGSAEGFWGLPGSLYFAEQAKKTRDILIFSTSEAGTGISWTCASVCAPRYRAVTTGHLETAL